MVSELLRHRLILACSPLFCGSLLLIFTKLVAQVDMLMTEVVVVVLMLVVVLAVGPRETYILHSVLWVAHRPSPVLLYLSWRKAR